MTTPSTSLCLVLHAHQPVGNFEHVLAEQHDVAYAPMIAALERHPAIRVGLHYSGPLLEWLVSSRPDTVARIGALIEREQVEILGGGFAEPVLPALPDRDRVGQLVRLADEVERAFGRRPVGAWLAERVWEPDLPTALADAGYAYTHLDDAHLRAAGVPDAEHWGVWSTDDRGKRIGILPTEQGLREAIPFKDIDLVLDHLRAHATAGGGQLGTMGDDAEKFGAWPGTWGRCWGEDAWVDRFFEAIEANADWLATVRPADAFAAAGRTRHVHVPSGSYAEMGEWALEPDDRRAYTVAVAAARASGGGVVRWMRGGDWRNFAVRYREVGDLHARMQHASAAVAALPDDDPRTAVARDHLYRGQSNDCYWHGLFGGIYLSHLRLATTGHLIAAEDIAAVVRGEAEVTSLEERDDDHDGQVELHVTAPGQALSITPVDGGGLSRWDVRAARHALGSVLRRRDEVDHDILTGKAAGSGLSIDDTMRTAEAGLADLVHLDGHERRSGLVRILPPGVGLDELERGEATDVAGLLHADHTVAAATAEAITLEAIGDARAPGLRLRKTITNASGRLDPRLGLEVELRNEGDAPVGGRLAIAWSINVLGGGNPEAWLEIAGERRAFDSRGEAATERVALGNDWLGLTVRQQASEGAALWWYSVDTVAASEAGVERTHQGACLIWSWPLDLAPGASVRVGVECDLTVERDRANEHGS